MADNKKDMPPELKEKFSDKGGAFVTLSKGKNHDLRGCIGYILPTFPLIETIHRVSISSAMVNLRTDS